MLLYSKCLWTIIVSTLLPIVTKNLFQGTTAYEIQSNDANTNLEKPEEKSTEISDSSPKSDDKELEISHENAWDKRGWDKSFAVWGKRRWDNFQTWGKRKDNSDEIIIAQDTPEKRKWAKFTSWGKRDSEPDPQETSVDKRKQEVLEEPLVVDEQDWPINDDSGNVKSVVKRSWTHPYSWWLGQVNGDGDKREWRGFTSWGKRAIDSEDEDIEKRKWSKFTSWGKRDGDDNFGDIDKRKWAKFVSWGKRSIPEVNLSADKRKWSKFSSWGKRDGAENEDSLSEDIAEDKRRWTGMPAWGKRDVSEDQIDELDKRNWAKFASWGKRPVYPQSWLGLNTWGKRRWAGLRTWGKRSEINPDAEILARSLLQMFDQDGDGALNFEELNTYTRFLTSLPSKNMQPESDVIHYEE